MGFADHTVLSTLAPQVLRDWLRALPKAELHLHIEGTLEPGLMFALARRNRVDLPFANETALRAAYAFGDLQSFLDLYYAGTGVLRTEADFAELAWAYLRRAAADGVVRSEVFFDPEAHTARGVAMGTVVAGLHSACTRAEAELGLSCALILCFLRHLSEDQAFETLAQALPHRDRFIGVGLDSSERDHPPDKFARVFARCHALGLRVVAHAGEEGPPAYIWSALRDLGAQRIDHGVRAEEDPALLAYLAATGTPLTMCPLSNLKLCVVPNLGAHNLQRLLQAGLCVTVNSDDPAYFGGYVVDNYLAICQALPLTAGEVRRLARNSLSASFAPAADKARWLTLPEAGLSPAGAPPGG